MDAHAEKHGAGAWMWILGGLCLIFLILVAMGYAVLAYAFPQGKAQQALLLKESLADDRNARIPAERLAVLREVCDLASLPAASLPAVILLARVGQDALRDRQVSDEELRNVILVRDFVNARRQRVGYAAMGAFLAEHPAIQATLDRPPSAKTKGS